ncbi:TraB/GumN family protein [Olivibacter sp. XZL3]|uniref:TraB/GumN family protein n=1 Tax=Olivibacter sp. XZL3 TaxID=1735116 RepID=UPI001416FA2F|nr:TraB/GumN family protein [Olivibacter sp. XZL3]
MKRITLLTLILCYGFLVTSKAQTETEETTLWEISGKDLSEPSYLFGTFHLLCPEDLILTANVKEKFEASKQLYLEIDFSDPNIGPKMMQHMQMRDTTFHDLYDSATYQQLSDSLEKNAHLRLEMLNKTKPFALYSLVMIGTLDCQPASWELKLVEMAKTGGIPISGLETVAEQAAIFDTIPYKTQAEQLKGMILNPDSTRREIRDIIDLYKHQKLTAMNERITSDPLMEAYLDLMLYNRNANWIAVIGEQAKLKPTFFAFGAGHLAGEKGVINLLRKQGYTVKPIH